MKFVMSNLEILRLNRVRAELNIKINETNGLYQEMVGNVKIKNGEMVRLENKLRESRTEFDQLRQSQVGMSRHAEEDKNRYLEEQNLMFSE